jgi:SAM-dependent methyltransferase
MKIDHNTPVSPILRAIPFMESGAFSPWPTRLLELEDWPKGNRSPEEVLKEYNDGWYGHLLELWEVFSASLNEPRANSGAAPRFFYAVLKHIAAGVEANKAIYRSSENEYLFSAGDEMMVGDLTLGNMVHFDMIIRLCDAHLSASSIRTVVEPGCGSGINLFHLYSYLDLDRIVGGDICSNAVTLANRIAGRLRIPGEFHHFDYGDYESLANLTKGLERYALITCHSIEQIQLSEAPFVDNVLNLRNRPELVLQFEPLVWEDEALMSALCRRYAAKNRYNQDLLAVLLERQEQRKLDVVAYRKRCFGLSAFNPTSFVCWKPR